MKILRVNGGTTDDDKISKVNEVIDKILTELEVAVGKAYIPVSCGEQVTDEKHQSMEDIATAMKEADGVIFTGLVTQYTISPRIQLLAEYLEQNHHKLILKDKNCMVLLIYDMGDSRLGFEYFSQMIHHFGGFDAVKIPVCSAEIIKEGVRDTAKEIIEKQVEDYYRFVRQNRRFLASGTYASFTDVNVGKEDSEIASKDQEEQDKLTVSEIYKKLDLDKFNKTQERDINEIAKFFSQKYHKDIEKTEKDHGSEISPRKKSCKQMTESLPHYFQPQMSQGLNKIMQINISGKEEFAGFININNSSCEYTDGEEQNPDITVMSDADTWMDVLGGKFTMQKAFMVGKLKVKGNFVLLSKFEQLFRIGNS